MNTTDTCSGSSSDALLTLTARQWELPGSYFSFGEASGNDDDGDTAVFDSDYVEPGEKSPEPSFLPDTSGEEDDEAALRELIAKYEKELRDPSEKFEEYQLQTAAKLVCGSDRITVIFEESLLTGAENSHSELSFLRSKPEIVTLVRTGEGSAALVFEEGKRHFSVYDEPYMFELCTCARRVKNGLTEAGGELYLDYVVELKGASAQHMEITAEVKPWKL